MASVQHPEFNLKESFEKVGILPIPILVDEKGNIIDGFNRMRSGYGEKVPHVVLPIKNRLQFNIIKLVVNGVRRTMTAEEKTATLVNIKELSGWRNDQLVEKLPFSKSWIMKYLPDSLKDEEMAELGRKGGESSRGSTIAPRRGPMEEQPTLEPETAETEEEFCKRFSNTFKSHLSQILKKDLPVIISHLNEESDCEKCKMSGSCQFLLAFFMNLKPQLPMCMQTKTVLAKAV